MTPGSRLILGLQNSRLTNPVKEFLHQKKIGGIILFDHNAEDVAGLKALIADIKAACAPDKPFIGIDFEGGRVSRLGQLFGPLGQPGYYDDNYAMLAKDCGLVAKQFGACNINLNFAPVCDLTYTPLNAALEDRTFSADAARTADYCSEFSRAFNQAGIITCFKHFPGLGSAVNDPHASLAISCLPFERFRDFDLVPYRAGIGRGLKMIMTTHVLVSAIDREVVTFSRRTAELARSLGFEGILVTDDMSMGALRNSDPLPERVLKALCAGHDMALICHDHQEHEAILNYLETNTGVLMNHGHLESLARIENVKNSLAA